MAKLHVVIVGAGIAGLTLSIVLARYPNVSVTVLDKFPAIGQVGNGIQVPCNAARVMRSLGLLDSLLERAGGPAESTINLGHADGKLLLTRDFAGGGRQMADALMFRLIHRADYVDVLHQETRRLGVDIKWNSEVQDISLDLDDPWVKLTNADVHRGDVVVGCDGINSLFRSIIHPNIRPRFTGQFAHRALLDRSRLSSPVLESITRPKICFYWLGPQVQIVWYALQDSALYNLVVAVADPEFNARCAESADCLPLLRERLSDWDPAVRELLDIADSLVRFPIHELEALPSWSKGCLTLMGDSAHPTLPNLGQGAAMCVEDGLVLGRLLGSLSQHVPAGEGETVALKKHIPTILKAYEGARLPRTALIVSQSRLSGAYNSLPWANDRVFDDFDEATCVSDWPWIDSKWNRELLSYKADEVAEQEFEKLVQCGALGEKGLGRDSVSKNTVAAVDVGLQEGSHIQSSKNGTKVSAVEASD